MGEEKLPFEEYEKNFPSDEFLEKFYGSREDLLKQMVPKLNRMLLSRPTLVYDDSHFAEARANGELKVSWNPFRWIRGFRYKISLEGYRQRNDPYVLMRREFDQAIRGRPMLHMDRMRSSCGFCNGHVSVFDHGRYGDGVNHSVLPKNEALERALCREFVRAIKQYDLYEDSWWRYQIEGDSVWIESLPNAQEILQKEMEALEQEDQTFEPATSVTRNVS